MVHAEAVRRGASPASVRAVAGRRCAGCRAYYLRMILSCAILTVTDPLGVYDSFRHGLRCIDPYYRKAFLKKWVGEHV